MPAQRSYHGHQWDARPPVRPALHNSYHADGPAPRNCAHVRHPRWALDYVFSAGGMCRVGAMTYPWQPRHARTAHLYPPGTDYWEDTRHIDRLHSVSVTFDDDPATTLWDLIPKGRPCAEFDDPGGHLGECLASIARTGRDRGEAGFWQAQARFFSVLDWLHQAAPADHGAYRLAFVPEPSFAARVDAYLRAHLAQPVTLAALARHLHVSASTLSHRYREEAGLGPLAAHLRLRINLARQLVQRGQPLKRVAEATGFYDAYHLSRTFKRIEGVSPRAFLHAQHLALPASSRA
jgi:AraC-like DNA-binding protein